MAALVVDQNLIFILKRFRDSPKIKSEAHHSVEKDELRSIFRSGDLRMKIS